MAANLELTVSQLNEYVRRMFQMDPMLRAIELKGEISNLKFHQSGALFFTRNVVRRCGRLAGHAI